MAVDEALRVEALLFLVDIRSQSTHSRHSEPAHTVSDIRRMDDPVVHRILLVRQQGIRCPPMQRRGSISKTGDSTTLGIQ